MNNFKVVAIIAFGFTIGVASMVPDKGLEPLARRTCTYDMS